MTKGHQAKHSLGRPNEERGTALSSPFRCHGRNLCAHVEWNFEGKQNWILLYVHFIHDGTVNEILRGVQQRIRYMNLGYFKTRKKTSTWILMPSCDRPWKWINPKLSRGFYGDTWHWGGHEGTQCWQVRNFRKDQERVSQILWMWTDLAVWDSFWNSLVFSSKKRSLKDSTEHIIFLHMWPTKPLQRIMKTWRFT